MALRGRSGPPGPALTLFRDAVEHWRSSRNRTLIATALGAVRRRPGDAADDDAGAAGSARTLEDAADDAVRLLDSTSGGARPARSADG